MSRGSTLAAAVATAAAVTVGGGGNRLLQLGNCGDDNAVPLFTYKNKERFRKVLEFSARKMFCPFFLQVVTDVPFPALKPYIC